MLLFDIHFRKKLLYEIKLVTKHDLRQLKTTNNLDYTLHSLTKN